jgi:hypothetical protein
VIDGSVRRFVQEDLIHIANQSYVKLVGLEIVNNVSDDPAYFVTGIGIWGKGEGIEIQDCKVHGIRYTGPAGKGGAMASRFMAGTAPNLYRGLSSTAAKYGI